MLMVVPKSNEKNNINKNKSISNFKRAHITRYLQKIKNIKIKS